MSDLHHECGIAAVYQLPGGPGDIDAQPDVDAPPLRAFADAGAQAQPAPDAAGTLTLQQPPTAARLIPRMLLEIQNRGQLSAGMTSYNPHRNQLIDTHKEVGSVTEVFQLNQQKSFRKLMDEYAGSAAIGHVRYATCGKDDRSYAQPFERHHIEKPKWFSFAFNGQLANYPELRQEILSQTDFHLARETDTEILMHLLCQEMQEGRPADLLDVLTALSERVDGAYNIVFLNALGDMFVARDPLGIRPLCYAKQGSLFAAASESVALYKLGFDESNIQSLPPGCAVIIQDGEFAVKQFVAKPARAHCFFEWIYFANVASTLDDKSVYITRKKLGEELAEVETLPIDDETIVIPVPDTAKAAADSMAYRLGVPCLEGLIRNRYVGRTFIEGTDRAAKVRSKFTPLPEVLAGKRVLVVEDSIVRSTTLRELVSQLRIKGRAREVHLRVACPPIVAPCFYGIDMSTVKELFAPKFIDQDGLTPQIEAAMADALGADSLRYLPVESIARCVDMDAQSLCQACITTHYPTPAGRRLYQLALDQLNNNDPNEGRTYD